MLRITRRAGERIMLGDDIVIEVSEVRGGTVRIGIDAPRSLPVYREEIWLEVKRENQTAAANAPGDAFADVARLLGDAGVERKPSPREPS